MIVRTQCQRRRAGAAATEKNVYCVIRSPHKYRARGSTSVRTHKRLIDIIRPRQTVDALMRIDLPASIDVNIQ